MATDPNTLWHVITVPGSRPIAFGLTLEEAAAFVEGYNACRLEFPKPRHLLALLPDPQGDLIRFTTAKRGRLIRGPRESPTARSGEQRKPKRNREKSG